MPTMDGLIAATGLAHELPVVTRNIAAMQHSGVSFLNPWEWQRYGNIPEPCIAQKRTNVVDSLTVSISRKMKGEFPHTQFPGERQCI